MNYFKIKRIPDSVKKTTIAVVCCLLLCFQFIFSKAGLKSFAAEVPSMGFEWSDLATKLDNYSTVYNAKRGQTWGSDSPLANADGGITNAPLAGNGNLGAVLGGSSAGQSINIGMNDFWSGQYDPEKVEGISPRTVGSVGYNILADNNTAKTDIDLATTYKTVTASNEQEGFPATAAVSGDYVSNAFWGMGWWTRPGEGKNSWLQLEFDKPITFSRFTLWNDGSSRYDADLNIVNNGTVDAWENGNTHAFQVQVSDDGAEWTTVHRETANYLPIYDGDLKEPATGKFVRLYITKSVVSGTEQAKVCKFSLFENAKNDKNMMPQLMNGKNASIRVSSNTVPDRIGQDAPHIYTTSTVYATVCGVQQQLSGYGCSGYGWFTDTTPSNESITYQFNKYTTFQSYQLWNGSASAANAYQRGDWTAWTMETSIDGANWREVHKVDKPASDAPNAGGQPAISSFNIPDNKLADCENVKYVRFTIKDVGEFTSRALLSQVKIFADTLENSGIVQTNETTYHQNIKEGIIGAEANFNRQAYSAMTSVSQDGSNYIVTEFKNKSNRPLSMRYYTSVHQYRDASYCQTAGIAEGGKTLYATRTTETADPSKLAWVSAATLAATIEGGTWVNTGITHMSAYGEFTVPASGTVRIVVNAECKQYTEETRDFEKITAANAPTRDIAILASQSGNGEDIIAAGKEWWKSFWLKSYVDIYDKTVEEYYYTALYIVGSATREDNVPTSLFGPFITSDFTAWGGTYVTDYNLYGTYMALAGSNREDLLKPLVVNAFKSWGGIEGVGTGIGKDYGDKFNSATLGKFRNADGSLMFANGVDGVLSAVVSGPGGYAVNMDGFYKILFTSAYAAIPVLSYYDMTQGEGKIAVDGAEIALTGDLVYTYLKDIMALWEQILIYENGVYKVKYDSAWENESNNMGNSFTIASMHSFTQKLIDLSSELEITEEDEPRITKWKHINNNMEEYPVTDAVGSDGVLRQSYSDTWSSARQGRVTYNGSNSGGGNPNVVVAQSAPLDMLGLYSDPAKKELMRNSLNTIQSWSNINAMPTIFSVAAKTGYASVKYGNNNAGDRFDGGVSSLMAQMSKTVVGGFRMNNISRLVDPLILIDTCGGVQGINDILVNKYQDIITFFPAYESNKEGKFVNVQVSGGYLISAKQESNGAVTFAKIESKHGGDLTVAIPSGQNWDVIDSDGNLVEVTRGTIGAKVGFDDYNAVNSVSFTTEKGKSYYMVDAAADTFEAGVNLKSVIVAQELYMLGRED